MADYEFPLDFQELFYLHQDIEQNRPGFELLSAAGQGLGFHVQKQLSLLFQQPLHSVVPVAAQGRQRRIRWGLLSGAKKEHWPGERLRHVQLWQYRAVKKRL